MNSFTQNKLLYTKASILFCCAFFLMGCTAVDIPEVVLTVEETVVEPMQTVTSTFFLPIMALHHVGTAPSTLSESAAVWYISPQKLEAI